ncbi:hypothetical protein B0O80DRAFT_486152 [Mortierella sp. GBAus27b]|nr:hypothetical protein B0O80DRAFT_486152 [Mortierella sp. GBAus27b]
MNTKILGLALIAFLISTTAAAPSRSSSTDVKPNSVYKVKGVRSVQVTICMAVVVNGPTFSTRPTTTSPGGENKDKARGDGGGYSTMDFRKCSPGRVSYTEWDLLSS